MANKRVRKDEDKAQKIFGIILAVLVLCALVLLTVVGIKRTNSNVEEQEEQDIVEPVADKEEEEEEKTEKTKVVKTSTKKETKKTVDDEEDEDPEEEQDEDPEEETTKYEMHYILNGEEVYDGLENYFEEGTELVLPRTYNSKTVRWSVNDKTDLVYALSDSNIKNYLKNDQVVLYGIIISEEDKIVTTIKYINIELDEDGEVHKKEFEIEYTEEELEDLELPNPIQMGLEFPKYYVIESEKTDTNKLIVNDEVEEFDEETMIKESELDGQCIVDKSESEELTVKTKEPSYEGKYAEEKLKEFSGWVQEKDEENNIVDTGEFVDTNGNTIVENGEYTPSTEENSNNVLRSTYDVLEEDQIQNQEA